MELLAQLPVLGSLIESAWLFATAACAWLILSIGRRALRSARPVSRTDWRDSYPRVN